MSPSIDPSRDVGREILLDRIFRLRENGTDARTEVLAGATTFVTLA